MWKSSIAVLLVGMASLAFTDVKLPGYFIARSECPAFQSFKKGTNPGDVKTETDRAYLLFGKNGEPGTHYKIRMDVLPNERWVEIHCGEHVVPFANTIASIPESGYGAKNDSEQRSASDESYVLAVNWQPAFCETKTTKSECKTQTEQRFDATHFSLHGLWPKGTYCGVDPAVKRQDIPRNWEQLPVLNLSSSLRSRLDEQMPGTQSFLHRHEWIKHGTCYPAASEEKYFEDSLALLNQLNDSKVRPLFEDHISMELSADSIRNSFDESFGSGAGKKVKINCKRDGDRNLIVELQIALRGRLNGVNMAEAMKGAKHKSSGCDAGIVDPVGLQ